MHRLNRSQTRVAVMPRQWMHRLAVALMIALAIGMLLSGRDGYTVATAARGWVGDGVSQMLMWMTRPIDSWNSMQETMQSWQHLKEEHAVLSREVARLKRVEAQAMVLEKENSALRELLAFVPGPAHHVVAARLLGNSQGGVWQSAMLNVGRTDGLQAGQAVMNETGLVGRVADVGQHSARVMFLTDANSRIPVLSERSGLRGVLSGKHQSLPELLYIAEDAPLAEGELLLTSGDGGLLPAGVPVGVVVSRTLDQIQVRPLVDWQKLDYVRVLQLQQVLKPEDDKAVHKTEENAANGAAARPRS